MTTVTMIFLFIVEVAGLAGGAAGITAALMLAGPPPRTFPQAFRLAYPTWLATFALMMLSYSYVGTSLPGAPAAVPAVLMLGLFIGGGWAAVRAVRAGRRSR
ncbi:MAG: hypothetical protein ACOH1H_10810 [Brevundimonas sp.]